MVRNQSAVRCGAIQDAIDAETVRSEVGRAFTRRWPCCQPETINCI